MVRIRITSRTQVRRGRCTCVVITVSEGAVGALVPGEATFHPEAGIATGHRSSAPARRGRVCVLAPLTPRPCWRTSDLLPRGRPRAPRAARACGALPPPHLVVVRLVVPMRSSGARVFFWTLRMAGLVEVVTRVFHITHAGALAPPGPPTQASGFKDLGLSSLNPKEASGSQAWRRCLPA